MACTCAGTAPGYPQHEQFCDLVTGRDTAADERRDELDRIAAAVSRDMFGVDDPWTQVAS